MNQFEMKVEREKVMSDCVCFQFEFIVILTEIIAQTWEMKPADYLHNVQGIGRWRQVFPGNYKYNVISTCAHLV